MDNKRPYDDLLKNLFHEQAAEIVPLLLPGYHVEDVYDIEMPDIKSTPLERPPNPLEEGIVGLAIPEAKVVQVYRTEWIEHSGEYERAYRITTNETHKPSFLVVEVQTEREEDNHLPRRLLANFVSIDRHIREDILRPDELQDEDDEAEQFSEGEQDTSEDDIENDEDFFDFEDEQDTSKNNDDDLSGFEDKQDTPKGKRKRKRKGTVINTGYYVYPFALCPFPSQVPAPIRDEFMGRVMLAFNFKTIKLWEKDAREFLNQRASSVYYLLPMMMNADADLLKLAIEQLAERFQNDQPELARHLTGLNLMLQRSEIVTEEEKQAAQKYLQPFAHLLGETLI